MLSFILKNESSLTQFQKHETVSCKQSSFRVMTQSTATSEETICPKG